MLDYDHAPLSSQPRFSSFNTQSGVSGCRSGAPNATTIVTTEEEEPGQDTPRSLMAGAEGVESNRE